MVKDRLLEMQKLNRKESVEIVANLNDTGSSLRGTFERADVIGQWLNKIEENNKDIKSYLPKLVDVNFKDIGDKISSLFENNTALSRQIWEKLRKIDEELKETPENSTDFRIKTIQFTTLKKRLDEALLVNSELLQKHKNNQQEIVTAQLKIKGVKVSEEEVAQLIDEGKDIQVFTENILIETSEARRVLADVEERYEKLLQIERLLTDVKNLFTEMAILINEQKELVDRIEFQAEIATTAVHAVDLKSVKRSKRKYMKMKICLGSVIAVIVIILIIALIRPFF